jgi:hypothetical protein
MGSEQALEDAAVISDLEVQQFVNNHVVLECVRFL